MANALDVEGRIISCRNAKSAQVSNVIHVITQATSPQRALNVSLLAQPNCSSQLHSQNQLIQPLTLWNTPLLRRLLYQLPMRTQSQHSAGSFPALGALGQASTRVAVAFTFKPILGFPEGFFHRRYLDR